MKKEDISNVLEKEIKKLSRLIESKQAKLSRLKFDRNATMEAMAIDKKPETDSDVGERVCGNGNLSYSEMAQIAQFSGQQLYKYLFNEPTVYAKGKIDLKNGGWVLAISRRGLRLLPELETPAIRSLENQIIRSLQNAVSISQYEKFAGINNAPYLYKVHWSDGPEKGRRYIRLDEYEAPFSEKGENERDGRRISAKLKLPEVSGHKFLATPIIEPCMFFRYHPNEIKSIAPKGANAYEIGWSAFVVRVWENGNFSSPLIAGKDLQGGIHEICSYAVTPIKFYKIDTTLLQKLDI